MRLIQYSYPNTRVAPSLGFGAGMAYVRADVAEPGTEVTIDVRGKHRPARIASKPLYERT